MTDEITDEELDRWQALADAATEGPWVSDGYPMYIMGGDGHMVAETRGHGAEVSGQRPEGSQDANHYFIAESREAVPRLIAALRAERVLASGNYKMFLNERECVKRLETELAGYRKSDAKEHIAELVAERDDNDMSERITQLEAHNKKMVQFLSRTVQRCCDDIACPGFLELTCNACGQNAVEP